MVTVARQLWLRRNKVVLGGDFLAQDVLVRLAKEQMEACDIAAGRTEEHRPLQINQVVGRWIKPPEGTMKINWDAAVDSSNGKIGMGIIARDHVGRVIAMACGSSQYICNSGMAEAMAAREAIELCNSLGVQNFILEGDASDVVNALNQEGSSMGLQGQIINDAKMLLNSGHQWKIQHIRRIANGAAHQLDCNTMKARYGEGIFLVV